MACAIQIIQSRSSILDGVDESTFEKPSVCPIRQPFSNGSPRLAAHLSPRSAPLGLEKAALQAEMKQGLAMS